MAQFLIDAHIDWVEFRKQKEFLLNHGGDEAMGLLHLLDNVQDNAVRSGIYSDEEVFGESVYIGEFTDPDED